jgi:alpha-L-fucosidase
MQWWREGRFGMFFHWGLYSIPAGTWDGKQIPGIGEWIMNNASIPVAEYKASRPGSIPPVSALGILWPSPKLPG